MLTPRDNPTSLMIGDSPIALRRDLSFVTIHRGLNVTHIIKDPVNLKYYEFEEHEIALIHQLDGRKGADEICRWFNRRFPPLMLTHQALYGMVWRLYQQGLLLMGTAGQGRQAAKRDRIARFRQWTRQLSQPWVIRLPGISPGPWIDVVRVFLGGLFSPVFVAIACLLLLLTGAMTFTQQDSIGRMRFDSVEFFSRENLIVLGMTIVATKILHELGHAVAASRYGCECHEMGVLLLAGMPSLYCDVSDAWMLPSRWQRISVSLAGIWIEALIAASAFAIWMTSVPGVVHTVSFNIMIVCSIGTIMFNANPLVRYDGYYVLMDATGVPNLGQRANEALGQFFSCWVFGMPDSRPLDAPRIPRWCLFYGFAAILYRIFLTCAILWGLHFVLKPFSLDAVVWLLAAVALVSWTGRMVPVAKNSMRKTVVAGTPWWRVALGVVGTFVLMIWSVCVPLPWYVFGNAILEPADQQTIVAAVPGRLVDHKDAGDKLDVGDSIVRLENLDIQREVERIDSAVRAGQQRLQALQSRRNQDPRAAEQIPSAEASLAADEQRLSFLMEERRRLDLRAQQVATVYPAPFRLAHDMENELSHWSGSLLDPVNRAAWVDAGEAVCQIGSIDQLEAIAVLEQDDLESVTVGQSVDIYLRSADTIVPGEVVKISGLELNDDDRVNFGLPVNPTGQSTGKVGYQAKWYQVQIRCRSMSPEGTMVRSRSRIRIHVGKRSFAEWMMHQFFKTFRWHA